MFLYSNDCNAYKYHPANRSCELAKLTYLEDGDGGEVNNVHVDVEAARNMDRICRGGGDDRKKMVLKMT